MKYEENIKFIFYILLELLDLKFNQELSDLKFNQDNVYVVTSKYVTVGF